MTRARLRVDAAGPLTSWQDAGRPGHLAIGVPPSGPIDRLAFAAAARLLDAAAPAAIELSHGGVRLTCLDGAIGYAVTGAAVARVDGGGPRGWYSGRLDAGTTIDLQVAGGNWGYLAFADMPQAPRWLGSIATHALSGLGGGIIHAGAVIDVTDVRDDLPPRSIAAPTAPVDTPVRVVIGPQDRFFAADTLALLAEQPFAVSARMNRMGLQLDGPRLQPIRVDMPSEPALRGCLQVDGGGALTALLADHQTTGGYPRIATVLDADIDALAQRPVGSPVRFRAVTPAEAIAAARAAATARRLQLDRCAVGVTLDAALLTANLIDGVVAAR